MCGLNLHKTILGCPGLSTPRHPGIFLEFSTSCFWGFRNLTGNRISTRNPCYELPEAPGTPPGVRKYIRVRNDGVFGDFRRLSTGVANQV